MLYDRLDMSMKNVLSAASVSGVSPLAPSIAVVTSAFPQWPLGKILTAVQAAQISTIELTVGPGGILGENNTNAAAAIGLQLADAGIALCGISATKDLALGSDGLFTALGIAAELDSAFVRVYPPVFEPDVSLEFQIFRAATALRDLAIAASYAPTRILVEMAPGTIAPSPELARRIIELVSVPTTGVVYDPGNLVAEGYLQPKLALALLSGLVGHVHVKNRSIALDINGRWFSKTRSLEKGFVDWVSTLQILMRQDYRGVLSIDHLSGSPSVKALCSDVTKLREIVYDAAARVGTEVKERGRLT